MTTQPSLRLPKLRGDQYEIALDTHKIRAVACGRRWGKTVMGSALTLTCAAQGYPVAWVAPQHKNSRPLWRAAKLAVRELKAAGLVKVSDQERTIEFLTTGGVLEVHSAENADAILGNAYKLVCVDEAGLIPEDVINEIIFPTLSDYDGDLVLIGSPKGLSNLFYLLWQRGMDGDDEIASWNYPTMKNPSENIQRAAIRAKKILPDLKWRQEFGAEFLSDGNSVFTNIEKLAVAEIQHEGNPQHEYLGGLDFGKMVDYTAFVTYDLTIKAIVNVMRINEIDYKRQRVYINDVYKRFKHRAILAEQNSIGIPMSEELKADKLPIQPFTTTNATKNELVDMFALKLQNEELTFIPDSVLIGELRAFTGKQSKTGLWQYSAPAGLHDDTVIAAMLSVYGSQQTVSLIRSPALNLYASTRGQPRHVQPGIMERQMGKRKSINRPST